MLNQVKIVGISACSGFLDLAIAHRITDGNRDKSHASYFTATEQQLLMEFYEEVNDTIRIKSNTNAIIKEREKAWQTIADRFNAEVVQNCTLHTGTVIIRLQLED